MNIKAGYKRILCTVDTDLKNHYQLTEDINIVLERDVEEYNNRVKMPVNGIVVDGEGFDGGEEVLINHNSAHPVNQLFDHNLNLPPHVQLYSIPAEEVYIYRKSKDDKWLPTRSYLIVDRIWEQYKGILVGIPPKVITNKLFVLEGEPKHKVVATAKWCDYTIIFQEANGREAHLTRMKAPDEYQDEVLAIEDGLTEKVLNGDLLIGETAEKARKFEIA